MSTGRQEQSKHVVLLHDFSMSSRKEREKREGEEGGRRRRTEKKSELVGSLISSILSTTHGYLCRNHTKVAVGIYE